MGMILELCSKKSIDRYLRSNLFHAVLRRKVASQRLHYLSPAPTL